MQIHAFVTYWMLSMYQFLNTIDALTQCPGDTRPLNPYLGVNDPDFGKCNHDQTHRVCARIGDPGTSFWSFTGQSSWCGSSYNPNAADWQSLIRCPIEKPTWCICKWATARWISGQGCNDSVQIDCDATDVCNLKASYIDGNVDLQPARDCVAQKCAAKWNDC